MKCAFRLIAILWLVLPGGVGAVSTTPPQAIRDNTPRVIALTNARIVVSPDWTIESGTLVIEDGLVRDVGSSPVIPATAVAIDLSGKTVYPGFIDAYSNYGLPEMKKGGRSYGGPKYTASDRCGGSAWNEAIHAEVDWANSFRPDRDAAEKLMRNGFTAVQTARFDGVFRGRAAVVLLGDGLPNDQILRPLSHHFASFDKGESTQDYPASLMGAIALVRQTLLDADWYRGVQAAWEANAAQPMPEFNSAIAALGETGSDTLIFAVSSDLDILRAQRIGAEMGRPVICVGSGAEYRRASEIAASGGTMILPLTFADEPTVKSYEDELDVSLAALRHWERAPSNPAVLEEYGIAFALTSYGIDPKDFLDHLRQAVRYGLSEKSALRALTTLPARICGIDRHTGTLERGKLANFTIWDGNIFEPKTKVQSVWVTGRRHEFEPFNATDFRGTYAITVLDRSLSLALRGQLDCPEGELTDGDDSVTIKDVKVVENRLSFTAKSRISEEGTYRFSAQRYADSLIGWVSTPDGERLEWSAVRTAPFAEGSPDDEEEAVGPVSYISRLTTPHGGYGFDSLPSQQDVLVRNATIWTCDEAGVLEGADLLVRGGTVVAVGQKLTVPEGVAVIDASGKHVTPGIIDEHSHIAISGDVNEGSHAITCEVRIGDVIDPDDVNIYRQLAGGVTASRILHGSANPIGGEATAIKLRWGSEAEDLVIEDAPRACKFALGENVKQSGWGDRFTVRYPQTRLGVDAIIRDAFQSARAYEQEWERYRSISGKQLQRTIPPRRDLQLEALADMLSGRMQIHCHAYVAPEMLMMVRLAEEFGLKIQSFAHGLEGYKIAPELAEAGIGVGSISDWWAYKFETYDGIPQSPALMMEKQVSVAINSDSPELARRLNQEAAKSIMYGGMTPENALEMVTINPAKFMGIDHRTGSLRPGKDADFVIWSDHPLSIYARVEQTWIEGSKYFDLQADRLLRERLVVEKHQLIQKVLSAGEKPKQQSSPAGAEQPDRGHRTNLGVTYGEE